MTMKLATRSPIYLSPTATAFDPDILSEIEALEHDALLSLVAFKLNGADRSDNGNAAATECAASSQLPPKKRIIKTMSQSTAAVSEASVPWTLYARGDEKYINPTHNILRRDILEVFIESPGERKKKGRTSASKAIKARKSRFAGRIGLRCRFCKHFPQEVRAPLSHIYPEALEGIYRATSIRFQKRHLDSCEFIPDAIRKELKALKDKNCRGSKSYWVESALRIGLRNSEDNKGITLCPEINC